MPLLSTVVVDDADVATAETRVSMAKFLERSATLVVFAADNGAADAAGPIEPPAAAFMFACSVVRAEVFATDMDWLRSRSNRIPPACGSDSDGVKYLRLVPLSAESDRFSRLTPDFLRIRAPNVRLLVSVLLVGTAWIIVPLAVVLGCGAFVGCAAVLRTADTVDTVGGIMVDEYGVVVAVVGPVELIL